MFNNIDIFNNIGNLFTITNEDLEENHNQSTVSFEVHDEFNNIDQINNIGNLSTIINEDLYMVIHT